MFFFTIYIISTKPLYMSFSYPVVVRVCACSNSNRSITNLNEKNYVNLNEDYDCYHNENLTSISTFRESNDYTYVFNSGILSNITTPVTLRSE